MKHNYLIFTFVTFFILCFSNLVKAQKAIEKSNSKSKNTTIQVIQFHSEHRCVTCNLIEKLTRETLKSYPNIPFLLVNVDEEKNEMMAEEFEATGTALFIYNPITKSKKDLTDFAFMNVKTNPNEFKKGLKKALNEFKK